MNKPRYLSIVIVGLFLGGNASKGDTPDASAVNPYTQFDPDGVPLAVTQPGKKELSPEEVSELRKEQDQAEHDKDWLLRAYEQQLHNHASESSQEPDANLYYQLSSNKDLAKLAGLPVLDSDKNAAPPSDPTDAVPPGQGSAPMRSDTSSAAVGASLSHRNLFEPLVTPLSAPDAAGLHNFYSSLPAAGITPFYGSLPQKSAPPAAMPAADSSDIDTPGMVADKDNPLSDPRASELNLEMLPGESIEQARAHQDNNNSLQLPLAMDADHLHKAQAAALTVPGQSTTAQNPAKTPASSTTVPTQDPEAPIPVSQVPQISAVRPAIANPFDILNR